MKGLITTIIFFFLIYGSFGKNQDTLECEFCKFFVEEIEQMISSNKTEEHIIEVLDKICYILPKQVEPPCVEFIEKSVPELIDLLQKYENPKIICENLKLCFDFDSCHKITI